MNKTWINSLELHFRRLYPDHPIINIEELVEAMKLVPEQEKNLFATYSIKSKIEDKQNPEDQISFAQFVNRIQSTYKDTKDTLYIDAYFKLIDTNSDGFITYDDISSHSPELGNQCISQKAFFQLAERLTHQGTKLGKNQFIDIVRQYI